VTPGETVVDATFGAGGHARVLAADLQGKGRFIGIDRDSTVRPFFERFERDAGVQARFLRGELSIVLSQLAPLRPASGDLRYSGPPLCRQMATDLPSAEVTWRLREGEQHFYFYYGCDMERNRAIRDRLSAAPGLLPIGDFIRPAR